ncbi:hypothetical protein [Streptomyces wedmorensis]
MVAGEASQEPPTAEEPDLAQRLVGSYPTFLAAETLILRKKTGGKLSRQACRDVAHEAFMRVAAKVLSNELGLETNLPAYFRATSRNLAIDVLRAQKLLGPLDETALLPPVPGQPFEAVEPLEELGLQQDIGRQTLFTLGVSGQQVIDTARQRLGIEAEFGGEGGSGVKVCRIDSPEPARECAVAGRRWHACGERAFPHPALLAVRRYALTCHARPLRIPVVYGPQRIPRPGSDRHRIRGVRIF